MPIESPYPRITVPKVDVWTFFLDRPDREYPDDHGKCNNTHRILLKYPDAITVLFADCTTAKRLTFDELRENAKQFGKILQEQWGLRKGDVLATVTPNTVDLVPASFGALLVGGVICPMNFMYTVNESATQLASSKAKGMLTGIACLQVAREAALKVGLPLNRILLVGDGDPNHSIPHFATLCSMSGNVERIGINPKEDLAYLIYSSGTTGLPKGVMLTHKNVVANSVQMAAADGPDSTHWKSDRSLSFLPMYHIYGISANLSIRSTANRTRRCRVDTLPAL
jgi:4-coumarate--CoA ligase